MNAAAVLKRAVCEAIDRRERMLVASYPFTSVALIVRYDQRTGQPSVVLVKPESTETVAGLLD